MISNFLRSTRNLSSVHSGSGSGWSPLRSSSDPGRGESVLRSLLEPWSDCCKYPLKVSHWAAMALRSNFSSGQVVCRVNGAARSTQKTHQPTPREKFHVSSGRKKKKKKQDSSQKHFLKHTSPWGSYEGFQTLVNNLRKKNPLDSICVIVGPAFMSLLWETVEGL